MAARAGFVRRRPGMLLLLLPVVMLVLAGGAVGGARGAGSAGPPLVMESTGPFTTWQFNPWSANFPAADAGFVHLPLGVNGSPGKFNLILAKSWSASGNKVVVDL